MGICLIFNPAARGHRAAQLRQQLADLSGQCQVRPTAGPGDARALARQAAHEGFDTIVVAGGDGTINEVLNGVASEPGALARVRFGVLPAGTVNVLARELKLPLRLSEAWHTVRQGREHLIDLPYADFPFQGISQRRYFLQLAGAGADARANALVHLDQKKRWGVAAYVLAGCESLSEPKPLIQLTSPALATAMAGELVLIGNGRFYGGSFPFFPAAQLDDGRLDLLVFPRMNWATALQLGWGWLTRRLHQAGGAQAAQADQFELSSSGPALFQLDGENVAPLPARFGLLPRQVRMLVP